ncbi:MAG: HEAT repeat domain-containing protein [Kouleothrix sp.]|jgi:HEAT repeat protein|nr:HEAT repeat domain-containing protein [Kouleothrix sp.]
MPINGTPEQWFAWLTSTNQRHRHKAKLILGSLTPADVVDIQVLIHALTSENDEVIFWATVALGCLGAQATQAIPMLISVTHHPAFGHRQAAIKSLSQIGPNEMAAKAAIIAALQDASPFVRRQALEAMIGMQNIDADDLECIRALQADPDSAVVAWIEIALRNIGLQ